MNSNPDFDEIADDVDLLPDVDDPPPDVDDLAELIDVDEFEFDSLDGFPDLGVTPCDEITAAGAGESGSALDPQDVTADFGVISGADAVFLETIGDWEYLFDPNGAFHGSDSQSAYAEGPPCDAGDIGRPMGRVETEAVSGAVMR